MPFPFSDGTKNYLMELARERKSERERKRVYALSRRRRSAIINSARSFLSIVIGVGRGRVSLGSYSRYYLSFSSWPLVWSSPCANRSQGRDKMRITRVEIATAICFYLSGMFVECERGYDVELQLIAITCSRSRPRQRRAVGM